MDVVVVLALVVLASAFVISLLVLIVMCYRRKINVANSKTSPLRFSKLVENMDTIDSLGQLSPLIGELLDRNQWVYEASGLMQHCVAILRLCRNLTDKLATIQLSQAPPLINEAICMATRNIFPRFDDLLDIVASNSVDIRILEARATSLCTVCWSLYLPFTLLNAKYKELMAATLAEMNMHLITIRTAADLAKVVNRQPDENSLVDVKNGLVNIRNGVRNEPLVEVDEDGEPSTIGDDTSHVTETTPLVFSQIGVEDSFLINGSIEKNQSKVDDDGKWHPNGGINNSVRAEENSESGTDSAKKNDMNG